MRFLISCFNFINIEGRDCQEDAIEAGVKQESEGS